MAGFRIDRISEEVRHAVDGAIRQMNDPRITENFSITRADVTRDLRYAKIYVSILEDDQAKDMMAALKSAAGYLRRELGRAVDLRYTPELIFSRDTNIAYGIHIAQLLQEVNAGSAEGENSRDETVSE
ncbi:MAG: 30S ribosome-binding factor RbfA [Clostridia bacterium]|nr:30S ribosome-binding factor RbfA [Clostridia bacterium]